MNKLKMLIILISSLVIFGCDTVDYNSNEIGITLLTKEWIHSREEEKDSIKIFRPKDYRNFLPSRYRQEYHYKENGECSFLVLEPADRHYFEKGFWFYENDNRLLTITDSTKNVIEVFEIKSLTENLLKFDIVESYP